MEGKVNGMRTRVREPVKVSGGMDHPRCFTVQSAAPEPEARKYPSPSLEGITGDNRINVERGWERRR
jgi:hypothetical protein